MHDAGCMGCKRLVIRLAAVVGILAGLPAWGACDDSAFRQFDFWVGSWEVHGGDGRRAGHNDISREDGGCVLVERWQGAEGGSGYSMNFYDPAADHWRQLWVSADMRIDIAGGLVDDSMVLEGTIQYFQDGRTAPFRGTWTALEDGRVRQYFQESRDDEWVDWFEGFYTRADPDS